MKQVLKSHYFGTNKKIMKIIIIGTGYVGLVTGVFLAEIGHTVVCYDTNKEKINKLNKGNIPFYEKDLDKLLHKNQREQKICFSYSFKD